MNWAVITAICFLVGCLSALSSARIIKAVLLEAIRLMLRQERMNMEMLAYYAGRTGDLGTLAKADQMLAELEAESERIETKYGT